MSNRYLFIFNRYQAERAEERPAQGVNGAGEFQWEATGCEARYKVKMVLNHIDARKSFTDHASAEHPFTQMLDVLLPFKETMICLGSNKTTLIHADRVFGVLLNNLRQSNTVLTNALADALIAEIKKRRTKLSSLLQYLLDSKYDYRMETDLGYTRPSEKTLRELIIEILNQVPENRGGPEEEAEPAAGSSQRSFTFENIFSTPLQQTLRIPEEEPTTAKVRTEMRQHEGGHPLGKLLEKCLAKLLLIQPTSVQPERNFSSMNFVASKSRNSLSPNTFNSLVILRSYFRSH